MEQQENKKDFNEIAGRQPKGVRGYIRNLELTTNSDFNFAFRPKNLKRKMSAEYADVAVLGMSHQYQAYMYTSSNEIPLTIYMNALMMQMRGYDTGSNGDSDLFFGKKINFISDYIETARRFLESLLVPAKSSMGIISSSPPVILLSIPGFVNMACRLRSFDETIVDEFIDGSIKEWNAEIIVKEVLYNRLTMQDVLANGSFR